MLLLESQHTPMPYSRAGRFVRTFGFAPTCCRPRSGRCSELCFSCATRSLSRTASSANASSGRRRSAQSSCSTSAASRTTGRRAPCCVPFGAPFCDAVARVKCCFCSYFCSATGPAFLLDSIASSFPLRIAGGSEASTNCASVSMRYRWAATRDKSDERQLPRTLFRSVSISRMYARTWGLPPFTRPGNSKRESRVEPRLVISPVNTRLFLEIIESISLVVIHWNKRVATENQTTTNS